MLTKLLKDKHTMNFQVYDVDKSGYVEQKDLERWAQNLAEIRGWKSGTSEFENLVAHFRDIWKNFWQPADITGDGKVSIEEYLKVAEISIQNFATSQSLQTAHTSKANAIFTVLDASNNEKITQAEYLEFCQAVGLENENAESAFLKLDSEGKGYLTREEYLLRSEEFHVSDNPHAPGNWLYGDYET